MRQYAKEFVRRGVMFGAWSGPAVLAVVWLCLEKAGVMASLTPREAALGIFSTAFLGFVAAGISVVYQIEQLPKAVAALIQAAVLYVDYLGVYLLNGWILPDKVVWFTLIFAGVLCVIWLSVYAAVRAKVARMNRALQR